MKKKAVRKIEVLLHLLTATLFLLKGFDEFLRKLYFPGVIITGLALAVLTVLFLWRQLGIKPRQARISCYYLESPALLTISYVLYLEEKEFLPHVFLLSAFLYPAVGFVSSKKFKQIKKAGL